MRHTAAATFLFIAAASAATHAHAQSADALYARAIEQHRAGRWSAAYGLFISAANAGDPRAARVALFLHTHGQLLYRAQWDLSLDEVADWQRTLKQPARPGAVQQAETRSPARAH